MTVVSRYGRERGGRTRGRAFPRIEWAARKWRASARQLEQLDPVAVGVPDEAEAGAALVDSIRALFRRDPHLLEVLEGDVQVVNREGHVTIGGAQLVAFDPIVMGQLELRQLLTR